MSRTFNSKTRQPSQTSQSDGFESLLLVNRHDMSGRSRQTRVMTNRRCGDSRHWEIPSRRFPTMCFCTAQPVTTHRSALHSL
eukprot:4725403-Amphidinium_carterae.1